MEIVFRTRRDRLVRFAVVLHRRYAFVQAGNRTGWLWRYR